MPGSRRFRLCAIALATLCTAPSAIAAGLPLSSAANSAAAARPPQAFAGFVAEAVRRFHIPADWLAAIMRVESNGDARAISRKGAMGLMQIMPGTWSDLRTRYGLGVDPFDPHDNVMAGAAYLRELYDRFGPAAFLAAYQAGPSRVLDVMAGRRTLGQGTRVYLNRLARLLPDLPDTAGALAADSAPNWRTTGLFVVTVAPIPDTVFALAPQTNGLFVDVDKDRQP
jgi:soluble lytic murein transglycosylase-like protein